MLNRIALFAASLAAALVIAAGMALAGIGPGSDMAPASVASADPAVDPAAATTAPDPTPQVQVDTVYLAPKATPRVIVTKVIKTKPASHGDDGGGEDD